jgi:hypothetical protein
MMGLSVSPLSSVPDKSFEAFFDLLAAAKSPEATQKRLDQLLTATQKAHTQEQMSINALDELRRADTRLKAEINAAKTARDAQLAREREQWKAEQTQRLAQIETWEKEVKAALAQAEKDRSAAAKLRSDWEGRVRKIEAIVAA